MSETNPSHIEIQNITRNSSGLLVTTQFKFLINLNCHFQHKIFMKRQWYLPGGDFCINGFLLPRVDEFYPGVMSVYG